MRIDIEQFLALTVALGAIGAVGVGVYTARGEVPSLAAEVEPMETFGDDFELTRTVEATKPAPSEDPPLLVNPPAPDYADDVPTEVASNDVAGPDVEGW